MYQHTHAHNHTTGQGSSQGYGGAAASEQQKEGGAERGRAGQEDIRCVVASEFDDLLALLAQLALEASFPVFHSLANQRLQGSNVHDFCVRHVVEQPQHGEFCCDCFSTARRSAQQYVGICVVRSPKDLRLDGVKVRERVQLFVYGVMQRFDGQRVQVEERGVWRISVWENEVLEGDRNDGLRAEPAIRHCADVVLGRKGLENRDGEDELLCVVELLSARRTREWNQLAVRGERRRSFCATAIIVSTQWRTRTCTTESTRGGICARSRHLPPRSTMARRCHATGRATRNLVSQLFVAKQSVKEGVCQCRQGLARFCQAGYRAEREELFL